MDEARVMRETEVARETWSDPIRGEIGFRTIFGGRITTPDLTAGVADLEPGGWLGHHRHAPSEIYYVLEGEGALTIEGEDHVVSPGAAAYVPSNTEHGIRNTGVTTLRFFYAFAVGRSEEIEYQFTVQRAQ